MEETQHNPYIAYRTAPTALHFYRPNSNCNTLPIFSSTSPVYNTHLPFVTTSAESKGDWARAREGEIALEAGEGLKNEREAVDLERANRS